MAKTITFFTCCSLEDACGLGRNFPCAKALAQKGLNVHYLALHPNYAGVEKKQFVKDGVHVYYVGQMHVKKIGGHKSDFSALQLLWISLTSSLKMIRQGLVIKSDIIYCFQPQPINGFASLVVKYLTGRTLLLDCQDYEADINRLTKWQRHVFALFEDKLLPSAAKHITYHTEFLKERYMQLGYDGSKFTYIPNGIDFDRFKDIREDKAVQLAERLHLKNKKVVIYFGSLSLKSGHHVDLLLKAFPLVKKENPDAFLLIVGGGVGGGEDIALLKERIPPTLQNSVLFTGKVPPAEIPYYIKCAHVSIDPVKDTPANCGRSPLKIFESMAMGVPVVTSDMGDRKKSIEGGRGGVLVKPGDHHDLARGILIILNNDQKAKEMAKACQQIIVNFYWHNIIERLQIKLPYLFD